MNKKGHYFKIISGAMKKGKAKKVRVKGAKKM